MNAKQIWHAALGELQLQMSKPNYETWLRHTTVVSHEDNVFVIGAPTTFAKEWLEKRLSGQIKKTLAGIVGRAVEVRVVVHQKRRPGREAAPPLEVAEEGPGEPTVAPGQGNGLTLNPRYTFASFIVGASNRLAHAGALAVAENPAGAAYNPLFIYGGVGLGKTHLLHAIGDFTAHQGRQGMYVTSEKFTNDLINAIRERRTEDFRSRYRTGDILLVDDIQFIAGKEGTQEEFFHTFNALHEANKQIVLSSDRPPKAIAALEERLRSRFEWGLIADIQPPDLETRIAILRAKAEAQPIPIAPEVIDHLARKTPSNIRELEGSLNRIVALAKLERRPLTVDFAAAALSELTESLHRRFLTPAKILQVVAQYYRLEPHALRGKQRDKQVVLPRQVAMYLMREETDASLLEIGRQLGARDHTTVLYGWEKIGAEINSNSTLRKEVLAIRELLYAQAKL